MVECVLMLSCESEFYLRLEYILFGFDMTLRVDWE